MHILMIICSTGRKRVLILYVIRMGHRDGRLLGQLEEMSTHKLSQKKKGGYKDIILWCFPIKLILQKLFMSTKISGS